MIARKNSIHRPFETELNFALRLVDFGLIVASLWMATSIQVEVWRNSYTVAFIVAGVAYYLAAQMLGLYNNNRGSHHFLALVKRLFIAWGAAFLVVVFVAFATKTSADHSRRVILTWAALGFVLLLLWRIAVNIVEREARARGYNVRKAVIVGASSIGFKLAESLESSPWIGLSLAGFYDDRNAGRLPEFFRNTLELKGSFEDLINDAKQGLVEHVYIALPPRAEPRIADLVARLSDTTVSVHLVYDFGGFDLLHAQWSSIGEIPVMSVVEHPFYGVDGLLKRIEDIVIGSLILLIISLPMLIVAMGIKLTSSGPVFFKQRRYGLNGEVVKVLKFRTMTVCEDGDNVIQAKKGDQRITPFGAFLRRTSLDELPQFIQVVTGTMSIVGPRPHAVAHNETYRSQIKGYMLRHKVKPGITGWAQVNGWRGETDTIEKMEKRVEYDLDYIRKWHLGFDLRIIFLTIKQVVVGHNNAY